MTDPAVAPSVPSAAPPARSVGASMPGPAHIAWWSGGADPARQPIVELDVGPDDGDASLLSARVDGLRAEDPDRTIALVHPGAGGPAATTDSWRSRLGEVVMCLAGRADGFTGDTTPTSLARLRRWTADTLRRAAVPRSTAADVVLVVDELVSNVEEHAPGWMTVDLELLDHGVLVVVSDPHPTRLPAPGQPPPERPAGRGMMIVAALSAQWGVILDGGTKAVWAELEWSPRAWSSS